MKNIFIDWGITKPHTILVEQGKSMAKLQSEELESFVPFNAFIEAGCPHQFLYHLIEKGCEVYICNPKDVKELRAEAGKSDEVDVWFIRELFFEQPTIFHKLSIPERRDIQLKFLMKKYMTFLVDCARFKHRQVSYEKEYGEFEVYTEILNILEKKKKEALSKVKPLLEEELKKVQDIKGIGLRFLAGLLAVAHPKRFSTLSKYLSYCGYKESSWQGGKGKYSRIAKSLAWQMVKSLIMHKDSKFYPFYLHLKGDLRERFPSYSKAKLDGMARNRMATFLLKEFYVRFS